jgi:hypothetical protein
MPGATNTNILLSGAPVAMCLGVRFNAAGTDSDIVITDADQAASDFAATDGDVRMLFDNVKEIKVTGTLTSSAESNTENIDIEAADGQIVRFTKSSRIIDGENGTDVLTDTESDENATGEATIEITVNEADIDSSSWTGFLNKLKTWKDNYWYIHVPMGFNWTKRYAQAAATAVKADGWAYMLGKLSMDLEHTANTSPSTITLKFVSYKFVSDSTDFTSTDHEVDSFAISDCYTATDGTKGVMIKGTSPAVYLYPEDIDTGDDEDSEDIFNGKLILKEYS